MSAPQANVERACPECGASPMKGGHCWLCGKALEPAATAAAEPPARPEHRSAFQFSLASLMLFVTLCAVVLGAFSIAPIIGIGLAVLSTPALVWTAVSATRRRARGEPMSPGQKVGAFAAALGIVLVICIAAGIAFCGTCLVWFLAGTSMGRRLDNLGLWLGVGVIVGSIAALLVLFVAIRVILAVSRRRRRREAGKETPS